jgi:hypothetical protein
MMCQKIRPNEWGQLIREWRLRIRYVQSRDDVIGVFRQVVDEILGERCSSRNSFRMVNEVEGDVSVYINLIKFSKPQLNLKDCSPRHRNARP